MASTLLLKLEAATQTPPHLALFTYFTDYFDLPYVILCLPSARKPSQLTRCLFGKLVISFKVIRAAEFMYSRINIPNFLLKRTGNVRLAQYGLVKDAKKGAGSAVSGCSEG